MMQSMVHATCTSNPCQWNKGKNRTKNHKNCVKLNIIVPVKGKDLMKFISGTQNQKKLEVIFSSVAGSIIIYK